MTRRDGRASLEGEIEYIVMNRLASGAGIGVYEVFENEFQENKTSHLTGNITDENFNDCVEFG